MTFFCILGLAQSYPHDRIRCIVASPFMLDAKSNLAVPAGDYIVHDIGTGTGQTFSFERFCDRKRVALLIVNRMEWRPQNDWIKPLELGYDNEQTPVPVLKRFYIAGQGGFEIVAAKYNLKAGCFIDVAKLCQGEATVTTYPMANAAAPAEPAAAPMESAPNPQPQMEDNGEMNQSNPNNPETTPQPAQPTRERKRVRKD
jgi:hypothetical protein